LEFRTSSRKDSHIILSVKEDVSSRTSSWFEYVKFVHQSVLSSSLSSVDISSDFLGYRVNAPLVISGMTGGTELAKTINEALAKLAQKFRIPIGVGSQRAALEDPAVSHTFSVVREVAPDVPVIANIGQSQVARGVKREDVLRLVEMIRADAVAVHLNPLQEALQPEGEPDFSGFLSKLKEFVEESPVPVIIKQTGEGLSRESARALRGIRIRGLDVGGAGGTSFAVIEGLRARLGGLDVLERVAKTFADWGIPTAASILEVREVFPDALLIATGGVRSGVDVAKAIRLGADFAGIARPLLRELYEGGISRAEKLLEQVIKELKIAVFLTGSTNLSELREAPVVISGELLVWMKQRKLRLGGLDHGGL